jgi:preprotein translocase subunit SecE
MKLWNRVREFLENVWKELKRTSWPSKKEVQGTTLVVVVMVVVMAAYLGGVDAIFGWLSRTFLIGGS